MEAGLASALGRAPDAPLAVLETDEKYIPAMIKATKARVVVLLNLSRDQMDRAAEIWLLARRWREALEPRPDCRVVANADDPLVAWAAARAAGHLGGGRASAGRGLLVLPALRRAPAAGTRRLAVRGVRVRAPGGALGAGQGPG